MLLAGCTKLFVMALISSKEFYKRHRNEFQKHIFNNEKTLIISNIQSNLKFDKSSNLDFLEIDLNNNFSNEIEIIEESYDLIILSDVLEVSQDITSFLNLLKRPLKSNGKILITSINPIWNTSLKILEKLNIKNESKKELTFT